jgi:exodeoxyribonuclease-3
MSLTIVSANVAGLRGATLTGKAAKVNMGFDKFFSANRDKIDVLALQETKVNSSQVAPALKVLKIATSEFHLLPDAYKKGHAGVAFYVNPATITLKSIETPFENLPETKDLWYSGRYQEITLLHKTSNKEFVLINGYYHHATSPTTRDSKGVLIDRNKSVKSMDMKHKFIALVTQRMRNLISKGSSFIMAGDINIAHEQIDIKNYKGNKTKAGFLPEERAWISLWLSETANNDSLKKIYSYNPEIDYSPPKTDQFDKGGLSLHDCLREFYGKDYSIYTWWSNRGRAFDNDVGWRIDYQITTSDFAKNVKNVKVYKQPSFETRYSDHAPVLVEYNV